jgi:uracil-DNA glycosylase
MGALLNPFGLDPDCRRCPALVACRTRVVHGSGRPDAAVMLVGTAPGRYGADETGVPFHGDEAGRRLDWLLRTIGLAPGGLTPGGLTPGGLTPGGLTPGGLMPGGPDEGATGGGAGAARSLDCFVTNAVRCATPEGRPPRHAERESCADWLAEEILRVDPTVIVPMGSTAGKTVFELLLDEPFPGMKEAHGGVWQRHGYRVHPIGHVLRLPAEELRAVASRLVRVAVHARAERDGDGASLDTDRAERILSRFALARRLAELRARQVVGVGPESGGAWWVARMGALAGSLLASLRHVHGLPAVRPAFRFLGFRRGGAYVLPYDAARTTSDLHDALSFDPTPRGVFEYWLFHHHVWTPADSERYEVVHRESRLLSLFDPDVARELVPVAERRRLLPPRVVLHGDAADLTVVLHDRRADRPTLRIDRVRIGLADARVHYLDREERTCDPRRLPRGRWEDDERWTSLDAG